MADEYEFERSVTRGEAATVVQDVADGVASGTVRLGAGDTERTVEMTANLDLEVELEWPAELPDDEDAAREQSDTDESAGPDLEELVGPAAEGTGQQESPSRFELFEDRADEWRWRLVHPNGNVIATSGEGYTSKQNARNGLQGVKRNAGGAEVTERPDD